MIAISRRVRVPKSGNITGEVMERVRKSVEVVEQLTETEMWKVHGPAIWKTDRFYGRPDFYPVYRYEDFYSYSPLYLILLKGDVCLNRRVIAASGKADFLYYSGSDTIDRQIRRIGGPRRSDFTIRDPEEYAREIAKAMLKDVNEVEIANPGFTNIILVGGKDSLNLSLLPWKNPVLLASASPNYELVREFVARNSIAYDVVPLNDDDGSLLDLEIISNCCRNNLEHCRWGPDLKRLADSFDKNVIFWKGQNGDPILTPKWKLWRHEPNSVSNHVSWLCKQFGGRGWNKVNAVLEKYTIAQRDFLKSLWYRGAMWQGSHMSLIRDLTNSLVLSGYHGPAVRNVVYRVDFHRAVQEDVRPMVGRHLYGGPVVYPKINPGPPLSELRRGMSHGEPFVTGLSAAGIRVWGDAWA